MIYLTDNIDSLNSVCSLQYLRLAGVTSQQRMLSPPWHLMLPCLLSGVHVTLHTALDLLFRLWLCLTNCYFCYLISHWYAKFSQATVHDRYIFVCKIQFGYHIWLTDIGYNIWELHWCARFSVRLQYLRFILVCNGLMICLCQPCYGIVILYTMSSTKSAPSVVL
jgi:hypothetical protein